MLRLKQLAFDLSLKQREIADIIGVDQSVVSLMMKGRRNITRQHLDRLVERFGAEVIDKYDIEEHEPQTRSAEVTIFPSSVVDDIKAEFTQQKTEDEGALIPEPVIVPPAIMQRPETDSKEWVESREAQANADRLQIAGILKATDMVWKVEDEAMQPTLFQGEYVLIKEMDDEARIIDGRVYAIDTKYHGNLIRRVYDDGDNYRLDPINKDGFSSVTISKEGGFNRRYRILCHISTEISILPDVDEERRRQDRLIEEVGRAGNRVDRLIDLLEKKN